MTIKEIKKKIEQGELSCKEVLEEHLARIKKLDFGEKGVNAVITLNEEDALKRAEEVDEKVKKGGKLDLLEGIPVAVKDVICTKDLRTTAASKILQNFVPVYDATCVSNLKRAGAIIVAKANCDEFAHGASGENSAYGATRNPYDLERVAGGSSSGPGAIVAYKGAVAALGTDTGGSIRMPGGLMGLVGLKPTYGRVSRRGLIAMCSSTDTVAPIAHSVEDVAVVLEAISSRDRRDATSSGFRGKDFTVDFFKGLKGLKVAYPKELLGKGLDERVKKIFFRNVENLRKEGAEVTEISLELFGEPAVAVYYILVPSEISSNLARFDGICYGMGEQEAGNLKDFYKKTRTKYLGDEAKRRIMLGSFSLSAGYYDAYYNKAQKVRRLIKEEVKKVFSRYDLIMTPISVAPAFKLGERADPLSMYLEDIYSVYASLAGIPAMTVNGGWVENKGGEAITGEREGQLPIGIQLMAEWWDEETMLRAAYGLEQLQK